MNTQELIQRNNDFMSIYNRSYRLAAAVFMISNIIDQDGELRTKIKNLSLNLVSVSVNLKDTNFLDATKLVKDLEKNSLELMSILDIASVAGLISKMNAGILREEFQSFISELTKFSESFEASKDLSVKGVFIGVPSITVDNVLRGANIKDGENTKDNLKTDQKYMINNFKNNGEKNGNGHKRKELRKNMVLDFIKGHSNASIKDIVPNIVGCSEKTIQREIVSLIDQGKIKKMGERRWSRYSVV